MSKRVGVLALAFLICLMGCGSETAVPTLSSSIPQPIISEELATTQTATPVAPGTPPFPPTEISLNAETVTPTVESISESAITTPSPGPEATLDISRSLPPWILDPGANILLLGSQENQTIALLNADSGELHIASAPAYEMQPEWFWDDGDYYLRYETTGSKYLDLATGRYVTIPSAGADFVSPNGRYAARIENREDQSEQVKIIDSELGTEVELVNPFREYQTRDETFNEYVQVFWSPDSAFLAVVYTKHYYSDNEDRNLAIYTPAGELFRQYTNVTPVVHQPWSPAGSYRILYSSGQYGSPCILDLVEDQQICLSVIDEWADQQNFVPSFNTWSPSGDRISFVYSGDDSISGLCYYEIATEELACPITSDDLMFDNQIYAWKQFWSPDGRYLALFYETPGFEDVAGAVRVAVVNIETENIQFIEGNYANPISNPWRPPIP